MYVCSGDNGGANCSLLRNWWLELFTLFAIFIKKTNRNSHPFDPNIIFSGTQIIFLRDPLLQPMLATCCCSCFVPSSQVLTALFNFEISLDLLQGRPGHSALPHGTSCKWKSPGNDDDDWSLISKNHFSALGRTTAPSLRVRRPLVSMTSQRWAGLIHNQKRHTGKLQMTWNADSKWCERIGGSYGCHLAEGRPLRNDDTRFSWILRIFEMLFLQRGLCRSPLAQPQESSTSGHRLDVIGE